MKKSIIYLHGLLLLSVLMCPKVGSADVSPQQLEPFRKVQAGDDAGVAQASKLAKELSARDDLGSLTALRAMKGATSLGKNWLLGLANAAQNRRPASKVELEAFLTNMSEDGEARYTVFRWLTDGNAEVRKQWLGKMTDDPSPEIRYEAIALALEPSELSEASLRSFLDSARQPEQVTTIIERLGKLGVTIDQAKHFGFLTQWKFVGPFDNVGSGKFNTAYPIEPDYVAGKIAESYAGKNGDIKWVSESSSDKEGLVDLAKLYNNEKGCVVYGITEVSSPSDVACELRVGCINAQKVWVNGELVIVNEVYHTGMQVDQYIAPIKLKAGINKILIKVCQNEQKETWAQRYIFQARICDSTGKAISQ
ncbi:MAG: hypothetical protein ACKO9Q_19800 [Pirellula sp.]